VITHENRKALFYDDLLRGKTVLIHFMSIRGDRDYRLVANIAKVQKYLQNRLGRDVFIYSITVDPVNDTPDALADFAEAAKIDKKYADAFYNRCAVYNFRKEYDAAITECSQAIKLGPSADATVAGGSERLGKDNALSDYYAERGFAYFRKDDYVHALVDLDNAIRLNANNGRALKTRGLTYEAKGDSRAAADLASAKLLGE